MDDKSLVETRGLAAVLWTMTGDRFAWHARQKLDRLAILSQPDFTLAAPTDLAKAELSEAAIRQEASVGKTKEELMRFSGLFNVDQRSVNGVLFNLNELILRSFTLARDEYVGKKLKSEQQLAEEDEIYSKVTFDEGNIEYQETVLTTGRPHYHESWLGIETLKKGSYASFIKELEKRYEREKLTMLPTLTSQSADPMAALLEESERIVNLTSEVISVTGARIYLMQKFILEKSGVIELFKRALNSGRLNGYPEARGEIERYLKNVDPSGLWYLASSLMGKDGLSLFDKKDRLYKRGGHFYELLVEDAGKLLEGAKEVFPKEWQRAQADDFWKESEDRQRYFGLSGRAGSSVGMSPRTHFSLLGGEDPFREYTYALKSIMFNPFLGGSLATELGRRQKKGWEGPTNPVYMKIGCPFRMNLVLYGIIRGKKGFFGVRLAIGDMETKGTENDPLKIELAKGLVDDRLLREEE